MKNLQIIAEAIGYHLIKRHDGYLLCRNRLGVGGVLCENLDGVARNLAKHTQSLIETIVMQEDKLREFE